MTIIATTLTRVLAQAASFVILLLSAARFGAEGRGIVAATLSLANLVGTLGSLSIGRVVLRRIVASELAPREFHRRALATVLALFVLLAVLASLAALGLSRWKPSLLGALEPAYVALGLAMVPFFAWGQVGSQLFASVGLLMRQNALQAGNRGLLLLAVLALLADRSATLTGFVAVLALFNTGSVLLEGAVLWRAVGAQRRWDGAIGGALVRDGLVLHVDTIGGFAIASANVLVLNYFLTPADVGAYEMAFSLAGLFALLPAVVQLRIGHLIAEQGVDGAWPEQRRLIARTFLVLGAGALLSLVVVPWALRFLDRGYEASGPVFALLLLTVPGNALATMMGPQWIARGYLRTASALTVVTGALGLAASILLVRRTGLYGAVWSSIAAYGVALVLNGWFFARISRRAHVPRSAIAPPRVP